MKINDNIEKTIEYSSDLINISKEYNILIEDMYESIKKIKDTIEISEESSFEKLINTIISEKNIYTNYGTSINRLGNTILEYATGINKNLLEKGIKGSSILYDSEKITNDVIPPLEDAKKYINSALNCINEIKIDFDCGQNSINNDISQIIKKVDDYKFWNINTKEKYNNILDSLKMSLQQTKIEQINKRTQNINTI